MMIEGCRRIVAGHGEGRALVTSTPINFLTMINAKNGSISDPKHELCGRSLKQAVLVFPYAVGSSVGAYTIYSMHEFGSAPSAVVCSKADITTASGCAIAQIPTVDLPPNVPLVTVLQASSVRVEADVGKIILNI